MSLSKPFDLSTVSTEENRKPKEIELSITLEKANPKLLHKGQYYIYKLCTNPTSAMSSTYELEVPLFAARMVE